MVLRPTSLLQNRCDRIHRAYRGHVLGYRFVGAGLGGHMTVIPGEGSLFLVRVRDLPW